MTITAPSNCFSIESGQTPVAAARNVKLHHFLICRAIPSILDMQFTSRAKYASTMKNILCAALKGAAERSPGLSQLVPEDYRFTPENLNFKLGHEVLKKRNVYLAGRGSLMKDAVGELSFRICMLQRFWSSTHAKDYESGYFSLCCTNFSHSLLSIVRVSFQASQIWGSDAQNGWSTTLNCTSIMLQPHY